MGWVRNVRAVKRSESEGINEGPDCIHVSRCMGDHAGHNMHEYTPLYASVTYAHPFEATEAKRTEQAKPDPR